MSPEHKNSNVQSKVEWQMIKLQWMACCCPPGWPAFRSSSFPAASPTTWRRRTGRRCAGEGRPEGVLQPRLEVQQPREEVPAAGPFLRAGGLRGRDQGAEQEGREPGARSPQHGSQESLNSFQPASPDPGGRQVHQARLLQEASVLHHVWQELLRPPDITDYWVHLFISVLNKEIFIISSSLCSRSQQCTSYARVYRR